MKLRRALLPIALIGAPAMVFAPPVLAAPVVKDQAAHKAACDELAAAVITGDDVEYQVDTMIAAMLTALIDGNPDFATMEAAFPGMKDTIAVYVRPVLLEHSRSIIAPYRADLSALYQENLTTEDALVAAEMFRRPEMRAFISSVNRSADYKALSKEAVASQKVSSTSMRSDLGNAGVRAVRDLTPEQRAPIMAFFNSPLGVKLLALGPQKVVIDTKWSNYTTPKLQADIMHAIGWAMVDHIAKTEPEMAKTLEAEFIRSGMIGPR